MLSSLYSHTDPTIEDASVINDNSPPILENEILMEDDDIFAYPSSSKFEKSKTDCSDENHYAGMEVLEQIKEKFQKSASNSEQVLLLTLAPKSWGRRILAKGFGASERQTMKAKKLVAEDGILTSPTLKKGKTLDSEIENLVKKVNSVQSFWIICKF